MKANKTYQVQQHGRKTEYKTKKAALNLADELAIYNESDNVSVYEYNHNTGIYTEIYTREYNTTDTPATMNEATKSVNDIMNQANRLMSECNTKRNFKRADAIRKIAFRYFDTIRACAGSFNSNDDTEYNKQYSRAQYMAI